MSGLTLRRRVLRARPILLQQATGTASASFTVTKGSLIVVHAGVGVVPVSSYALSDSQGNAYSLDVGVNGANGYGDGLFHAIASASGPLTVQFGTAGSYQQLALFEVANARGLNAGHGATGTGTTMDSGSATATAVGIAFYVASINASSSFAAPAGWTRLVLNSNDSEGYKLTAAGEALDVVIGANAAGGWNALAANYA